MKIPGSYRRTSALVVSSTMGLALTLAGCTSVEVASKADIQQPAIAATAQATPEAAAAQTPTSVAQKTSETAGASPATAMVAQSGATVSPAGTAPASAQTVATAAGQSMPSAVALKGGRVALPPAAEIAAAAAAIDAQIAPQVAPQQVALAAPAATTTPAVTAVVQQATTSSAALPQVVALKGGFPPAPGAPGTPSAAAIPLTEEMMKQQSVIPVPKPQSAMLAYASAPKNAALAAISTRESITTDGSAIGGRQNLSGLISKYASMYDVPEDLVHRVVQRESRYNPGAFNGGHFGLMQIKHSTARSMGFDGPASGLFDAETNLKYAVKYLRGAWLVADNNRDGAVRLYARGYYYDAKRRGMLHVLRK